MVAAAQAVATAEAGMALAIRGVAFDLDGETLEVLHDVDLEVAPGDFVAILGPSGCGKSTLLRLAAGLDRPREGTILADGVPIEAPDPSRCCRTRRCIPGGRWRAMSRSAWRRAAC